jgi:hypothetical protein
MPSIINKTGIIARIKARIGKNICKKNIAPSAVRTMPKTFGLPLKRWTIQSSAPSGVKPERISCAVRHASTAA